MKFGVILLSAFVVISDQQFQPQRGPAWWSPYSQHPYFDYESWPYINSYQQPRYPIDDYQPAYYDGELDEDSFYRPYNAHKIRPIPIIYPQNYMPGESAISNEENGFPDTQSRIKGFGRYRPSFINQKQSLSPRFFYSLINGNSLANPFLRTVTFTSMSTVTLATIQSCLSSSFFVTGSQNNKCRRKRDEYAEFVSDILNADSQFLISPSSIQQVIPTQLPAFPLEQGNSPLPIDEIAQQQNLISSKNEDALNETPESFNTEENSRSRRFFYFFNYVSTSTLISYSFVSTTITKAVNLVTNNFFFFGVSALICMPDGYVLCT